MYTDIHNIPTKDLNSKKKVEMNLTLASHASLGLVPSGTMTGFV
jgi:hypothetical protein